MKRSTRLTLTLLLTLGACETAGTRNPDAPAASPDAPAPALVAERLDGQPFDLAAQRGKLVLVDFWASWCEPCRRELPVLEDMYRQHAAAGLVIVGVSLDEQRSDAEAFLQQVKLSFPIVYDQDRQIGKTWAPPKMPSVYLIERDGTVARVFAGEAPGQLEELQSEVRRRLKTLP